MSGRVTSTEDGSPLPGVNVVIKGTTSGTVTDIDGNYRLSVANAGGELIFSFIGLQTREVPIGDRSTVDVSLALDVTQLGEIVVTAGGIEARRKEMGYNATSIRTSLLNQAKPINVAAGLTGKVAGLQINTVSSGVNPNVRVVLRGNRSITGNNEALVVVDNVIVPNDILSNLNPQDIEEITVLNGSNAAALYGSQASNGALIVTTKKGTKGSTSVTVSHTLNLEKVSFFPQLQKSFGSGTNPGYPTVYVPYENQQYGPRFDGTVRPIGRPLQDGSIQNIPYSATDDKEKFWETGVTNQSDISIQGGDDKSTTFFSVQYLKNTGTTLKDEYKRASFRLNGTRDFGNKVSVAYNTNYVQNVYDVTTQTGSIYEQVLNTPAQIPLTKYKDWQNDPFANPNGYFNEYYDNPYWTIDAFRRDRRDNYFVGNAELKWKVADWFNLLGRVGVSSRANIVKDKNAQFTLTDYTKSVSSSKTDVAGGVGDASLNTTQITADFFAQFNKDVGSDFNIGALVGNSLRRNLSKSISSTGNGIVIPGLYNISNRVGEPSVGEGNYEASQVGLFGQLKFGYKDYLFLELTGRNDWVSILSPENRSFFYPAASASFIASEAFEALTFGGFVSTLKLRGGWFQVGQVNLGNSQTFGAYELDATFSPSSGFPYGSLSGFTPNNRLVASNLNPEITTGVEFGTDFKIWSDKISGALTVYKSNTVDQTIPTNVSSTTGFTTLLQNTGEVENRGLETTLSWSVLNSDSDFELVFGGNYTYNEGKVLSISGDLKNLQLSTGGQAQVYAVEGQPFPILLGNTYVRDPQGRIVVDRITGYPSQATEQKQFGNTVPKHRLGLTGELGWKGFRLSVLMEYRAAYSILYNAGSTFDFSGAAITTATYNRERFVMPNSSYEDPENPGTYLPNNNITVADGGSGFWTDGSRRLNIADNYIISGDYWKLRELAISYQLPTSLLSKTKFIKSASITFQGRNLFIFTPKSNVYTDPDFNFSDTNAIGIVSLSATPPTRFFGTSISLTF
ncbi:SusC/RagA family TonB-linked outer membrane protein [Chryseotalea sanaruensis]|uniref:SusC/RagA family TonB-linked outer membrane protein n=1 Tax=Chryseotalea sanaruensis TaxID=2482724 RepID=A0A401UCA7_9BACT|nr:SusC/RagA family TonB-linked outer membrane protein [Chryseotalea sanaruensis]